MNGTPNGRGEALFANTMSHELVIYGIHISLDIT